MTGQPQEALVQCIVGYLWEHTVGIFGKKKANELMAPRTVPVGPWLAQALDRHPLLTPEQLIAAALNRIQHGELLRDATTYIGGKESYSFTEAVVGSVPSDLSIRQHGKLVIVSLGNYGLVKKRYLQSTDWAFSVKPLEGHTSALLQLFDTTMDGTELINIKTYRKLIDATVDTLQKGVAIESRPLSLAGQAATSFETVPFVPIKKVHLTFPRPFSFDDKPLGDSIEQLITEVIGPRMQSELKATGDWPILAPTETGHTFTASNDAAIRWFAHAFHTRYLQMGDDRRATVQPIFLAMQNAVQTDLGPPSEGHFLPQISADTRVLPLAVSFGTDFPAATLANQLSASATPRGWYWQTSRLPTKTLIDLVARPSRVERSGPFTLGFGLHDSTKGAVCGPFAKIGLGIRPPEWETTWVDGASAESTDAMMILTGLTHQAGEAIRGTEALLELIDAISDYAAGRPELQQSEPTMLMLHRQKSWT